MANIGNVYKTKGELILVVTHSFGSGLFGCRRFRHGDEVMSGRYSETDLNELFTLIGRDYTQKSGKP